MLLALQQSTGTARRSSRLCRTRAPFQSECRAWGWRPYTRACSSSSRQSTPPRRLGTPYHTAHRPNALLPVAAGQRSIGVAVGLCSSCSSTARAQREHHRGIPGQSRRTPRCIFNGQCEYRIRKSCCVGVGRIAGVNSSPGSVGRRNTARWACVLGASLANSRPK
jgi:hypothetical protein